MVGRRHPLEQHLRHEFSDADLLGEALTHSGALPAKSRSSAARPRVTNERLEFLGDRVLGLVIAAALIDAFPDEDEGSLAPRLAALVSAPALARVAATIDLAAYVKVAPGQPVDSAETGVLADACEAIIGALYFDGGLPAAKQFIDAYWQPLLHAEIVPPKDAKTALQEWAQARALPLPEYRVLEESGPAHAPSFVMSVTVKGFPAAQGQGRTKRVAATAAAAALIAQLPDPPA